MKFLVLLAIIAGVIWWLKRPRAIATSMTEAEARQLLGVEATADAVAIRAAHQRLITRVHPDAG